VVEVEPLPDPEPDAWIRRWCGAYLDHLEPVMRGDLRNFDLYKDLWRSVGA
jgi:hypothetical protein